MKLELKHLAPYLPYGLKMIFEGKGGRILEVTGLRTAGISEKTSNLLFFNSISETLSCGYFKPILRPISDLDKEITIDNNTFVPHLLLGGRPNLTDYDLKYFENNIINLSYDLVHKLIEWHFDVFGLIDKNLAISIHDVE